jgi:SAM-dependent methyltransferase
MRKKLLSVLACPECWNEFDCHTKEVGTDGDILSGTLKCVACGLEFTICRGIPRFVPADTYAESFGYQWNRFRGLQIDAENHTRLSEARFFSETGWILDSMAGKWIVDIGCGAGRFLEVASRSSADVVGLDLSSAVDAARRTVLGRPNVHIVQASMYSLPFRPGSFDACYCIGVLQHTPDPLRALQSLPQLLKPSGQIAVTIYERRKWTLFNGKYLIRHITRHLPKPILLALITATMPIAFPITECLFRLPGLGRLLQFVIPIANYIDNPQLKLRERYRWALMDTFDMLAPYYDQPMTQSEAETALTDGGIAHRRLNNPGLNLVGRKKNAIEVVGA